MKNKEAIEELRDEVVSEQRALSDGIYQGLSLLAYCPGFDDSRGVVREKILTDSASRDQLQYIEDRLHDILKEWE